MAAHADGDLRVVELSEPAAVHGGRVLGDLVHAKRRVVALHEPRVGMAAAAERGDLLTRRACRCNPFGGTHGLHALLVGVAAVARHAAESLGAVDVVGEGLRRRRQPVVADLEVAGRTVVLGRLSGGGEHATPAIPPRLPAPRAFPLSHMTARNPRIQGRAPGNQLGFGGCFASERLDEGDQVRHLPVA